MYAMKRERQWQIQDIWAGNLKEKFIHIKEVGIEEATDMLRLRLELKNIGKTKRKKDGASKFPIAITEEVNKIGQDD